jgi:hypothetical protein
VMPSPSPSLRATLVPTVRIYRLPTAAPTGPPTATPAPSFSLAPLSVSVSTHSVGVTATVVATPDTGGVLYCYVSTNSSLAVTADTVHALGQSLTFVSAAPPLLLSLTVTALSKLRVLCLAESVSGLVNTQLNRYEILTL